MILYQAYQAETTTKAYMVFCPRCKDRARMEVGNAGLLVCNCTVAKWKSPFNCLKVEAIKATVTLHKCGAKCTHAKGATCDCSCGGANHGKGWTA